MRCYNLHLSPECVAVAYANAIEHYWTKYGVNLHTDLQILVYFYSLTMGCNRTRGSARHSRSSQPLSKSQSNK